MSARGITPKVTTVTPGACEVCGGGSHWLSTRCAQRQSRCGQHTVCFTCGCYCKAASICPAAVTEADRTVIALAREAPANDLDAALRQFEGQPNDEQTRAAIRATVDAVARRVRPYMKAAPRG